ncbi:MAG: aromatic-ring-hydroxylating dioxygenase subunit beta [Hyphomicrobiales bacterium]|nr:aromatic-ring-hydroxylating dioxygenase subunit beta [Hyphomicrobiales bacterium]
MNLDQMTLHYAVSAFLSYEAELLDSRDFHSWLELFEEDGIYWVPTSRDQADMKNQVSIMAEDKALLGLRVERLGHPRAYSMEPQPATIHLIGNITVREEDGLIFARSKLIVDELRDDRPTRWSGSVTHTLRRREDGFGIVLKRVDLIQAGGTFAAVTIPL